MNASEKAQKELPGTTVLSARTSFNIIKQNFNFHEIESAENLFWMEIHLAYLQGRVDHAEETLRRNQESLRKAVQS